MRTNRVIVAILIILLAFAIIGYYLMNLETCNDYEQTGMGQFILDGMTKEKFVRPIYVSGRSPLMNLSITIKMDSSEHLVVLKIYNGSLNGDDLIYETDPGAMISARVGIRNTAEVIYIVVEPATPITDSTVVYLGEINYDAKWKGCVKLFGG
ncbi:MAG: hypothetical protein GXO68_02505 [Crenarchaeota archaeon]|nr:hypothetical protein [Thermoproteota archaeon]